MLSEMGGKWGKGQGEKGKGHWARDDRSFITPAQNCDTFKLASAGLSRRYGHQNDDIVSIVAIINYVWHYTFTSR